jgi:hypothetical protein
MDHMLFLLQKVTFVPLLCATYVYFPLLQVIYVFHYYRPYVFSTANIPGHMPNAKFWSRLRIIHTWIFEYSGSPKEKWPIEGSNVKLRRPQLLYFIICVCFKYSLNINYTVKKAMEKTRHKVLFWVCMEQLPYIHEINTLRRAITIHRWKTVLLLQQCIYNL